MVIDAVVLGAGSGSRFRNSPSKTTSLPKQFEHIAEKPVLIWAIESLFNECPIRNCVVVAPHLLLTETRKLIDHYFSSGSQKIQVVSGGDRRQDSSLRGLETLEISSNPPPDLVLIHDGCRPFLGMTLRNGLSFSNSHPHYFGWIPGLPVTETLKKVQNEVIENTVDRSQLFRVQTPQIFNFAILLKLAKAKAPGLELFTDDASLLESEKRQVGVFPGDYRNIKLTYDYEKDILTRYLQTERPEKCGSETATISTELSPL